jgi:hypothetical protein
LLLLLLGHLLLAQLSQFNYLMVLIEAKLVVAMLVELKAQEPTMNLLKLPIHQR